ncbi:hypothetical protein TWF696_005464 [Orbilia brochopaga]|uniref:Apple domain-containing protein n=1 Tax=Orbilia brochopaga TaxID=3140254 RepID=A0AAV9V0W5_9PEZI
MVSKVAFLLLLPSALAGVLPRAVSTQTREFCYTKYAKTSGGATLPTKTNKHVLFTGLALVIQTTHPVVTKSRGAVTSTATATSTVVSTFTDTAVTDTFSTTTTEIDTTTFTSTITTTSIRTATSTFFTSTSTLVEQPPNFTNVFDSTGDTTYVPPTRQKKRTPAKTPSKPSLPGIGLLRGNDARYPASVVCEEFIQPVRAYTLTIKLGATTTTVPASTTTQTITTTSTSTSTVVPPDVSTTETFTTSSTTTLTTATTVPTIIVTTATETVVSATSTQHAACTDPANLLGPRIQSGETLDHIDNDYFGINYLPSATDCCNACWNTDNCAASIYDTLSGFCYGIPPVDGGKCVVGQQSPAGGLIHQAGDVPYALIASNGPCGTWADHGTY